MGRGLDWGSMLPFLDRAVSLGWAVLITNTNDNVAADGVCRDAVRTLYTWQIDPISATAHTPHTHASLQTPILGSESPTAHAEHVWDHYIQPAHHKNVVVVAHSAGGAVFDRLLNTRVRLQAYVRMCDDAIVQFDQVSSVVRGVAFTDSVHARNVKFVSLCTHLLPRAHHHRRHRSPDAAAFLQAHAINWVSSALPLDTPIAGSRGDDCELRSAGHPEHASTTFSAFGAVFAHLQASLQAASQ